PLVTSPSGQDGHPSVRHEFVSGVRSFRTTLHAPRTQELSNACRTQSVCSDVDCSLDRSELVGAHLSRHSLPLRSIPRLNIDPDLEAGHVRPADPFYLDVRKLLTEFNELFDGMILELLFCHIDFCRVCNFVRRCGGILFVRCNQCKANRLLI